MERGRNQTIELRSKPFKMAVLFFISGAFVATGVYVLIRDSNKMATLSQVTHDSSEPWKIWAGIFFFGTGAIFFGYELLDRRPKVLIGPTSIVWGRWRKTEIPWSEISSVKIRSLTAHPLAGKQVWIDLKMRNPPTRPHHGISDWFARLNRRLGFGDIWVPATDLDMPVDDMLDAIERFRQGAD